MRHGERDGLLLLLAGAAGAADGWSYLGLGHAFVANMTGNTVLLGLAVFQQRDLAHPAIALLGYVVGVAAATWSTRSVDRKALWARQISVVLLVEAVLLGLVAVVWQQVLRMPVEVLLACVATGIGLQSGAMLRLSIPGIVTTYITGTWTTLMAGLVTVGLPARPLGTNEVRRFEERLLLQSGVIAMYLLAAIATGWLFVHAPAAVGAIPTVAVGIVAVYGLVRG